MRSTKFAMLAALALVAGISAKAQNADEILKKHEAAMGGAEKWDKIKTLKMTGTIKAQGMDIGITETIESGKAMRTDISVMGMNGYTIVTTKEGYTYMPFGGGPAKVDTMKADAVKGEQSKLNLKEANNIVDYKAKGTKAEYVGTDSVNSALCYKIKFTEKDGDESTSFYDAKTYYLLRTESKVKVDDQETEVAVLYSDYKTLPEGIVMPMSINAQGGEVAFKSVEVNKPIDASVFVPTMPAATKN